MKSAWTAAEDAVLRECYPRGGIRVAEVRLKGRTRIAIYRRATRLGVTMERPDVPRVRQRWPNRDDIDDALRTLHRKRVSPGAVRELALRLGRPVWWMSQRARQLGLVTPRQYEPRWSEAEVAILREHDDLSAVAVQRRLRAAGFARSPSSIDLKRSRLGCLRADRGGYSAAGLGALLGVHATTVARWISLGLLKGKETPGGDWCIRNGDLRAFMVAHPLRVEFQRVPRGNEPWLIDVLTGQAGG